MNETLLLRRDAFRRGGFTLIEVVIALSIFLFGALAIVRIFPPALGLIENSEDQLTAISLNRSTVTQLTRSPELVPDAVYDDSPTFTGAVNGTAIRNSSLPRNNIQDFDDSALGHFKNISRETQTVAVGSPTSLYITTRYAYDTANPLSIYEEDEVEGAMMRDDGTLNFSDATLKSNGSKFADAIDPLLPPANYLNANGAVPIPGDTTFYVSYSWIELSNIQSVVDEPLIYVTGATAATRTRTVIERRTSMTPPIIRAVEGRVDLRLRRLKQYIAATTPPAIAGDEYRGIIDLSTSAAPFAFAENDIVSLDYTVKDWRWLVNRESPTIKPDGPTSGVDLRSVIAPVRFFDKNEPPHVLTSHYNSAGAETQDRTVTQTDFKKGQVTLTVPNTAISSRSRVTYRTLDNWTQQLSVAARSYKPVYVGTPAIITSTPAEPWRDYVNPPGTGGFLSPRLYFRPSEAGKSVAISYVYTDGTNDVVVQNRILQIKSRTIAATIETAPVALGPIGPVTDKSVAELELTNNVGDRLRDATTANRLKSIRSVRGASIQSRTAWLDGSRFSQVSSVAMRGNN